MLNDEQPPADSPAMHASRRGCAMRWVVGMLVLLLFVFSVTNQLWIRAARGFVQRRQVMAQRDLGPNLPPVDEVEILALGGEAEPGTPDSFVGDMGQITGTLARRTVRGAEAARIAALWRGLSFGEHHHLCFSPHYALRFRHEGGLVLETSVCWSCHGYTLPMGLLPTAILGFDAKSEEAQGLLALLTELIPHPPEAEPGPDKNTPPAQAPARP